jgi:DNA mismatch repair protein MutL
MPDIRILPDVLVNKIAAGEVIERPASVVKELLENALDAGAGHIDLEVADGGRRLIRMADDGCGIAAEQLALALAPHATSKLGAEDDLFCIRTLGFRGEALASIAAVAQVRVLSRAGGCDAAAEIEASGGQAGPTRPAHRAPGTTVEVRDLFFNVPARRKFLRSAGAELAHTSEQLARVALAHPAVSFEMLNSGRVHTRLAVCTDLRERVAQFYGDELAGALLPVAVQSRGLSLTGFAAPPAHSRASERWQYFFVNGRYVRDRQVQHAIKDTYRGLIEPARFAAVFLHLSIDPSELDVNVHPTKIEVRWRDSQAVHAIVRSGLRQALGAADLTPALEAREGRPDRRPWYVARPAAPRPDAQAFFRGPSDAGFAAGSPAPPAAAAGAAPTSPAHSPDWACAAGPPAVQLHRTYLVTETDDGILIIDQHALHERIIYEQLRQRLAGGALESQNLLIPQTVELAADQMAALESAESLLGRLGIEWSPFDDRAWAVHAFPALLKSSVIAEFMRDLADVLVSRDAPPDPEALIHKALDMMACKAAVKAGDELAPAERQVLIEQRHLVDKGSNCPHGRPTALRFTLAELERQFKRR